MHLDPVDALVRASVAPAGMSTRVIAIDGPGGAGKSTLAASISERLSAPVIHTDDFASWDEPLQWWPRMLEQVLQPLSRNEPARFQRYDWNLHTLAEWHRVDPVPLVIIEGVSSSRAAFRPYLSFSIWVDTAREMRLARGLERDGEESRAQWEAWMAAEDEWISEESPREHANLIVPGEPY